MKNFKKLGKIFSCSQVGFFNSHSMRVIPYDLRNGFLRLFYSSRCVEDMMHPTFIDVEKSNPLIIVNQKNHSILPLGRPGCFDDSGITLGSICEIGEYTYVYYTGWKRRRYTVNFELNIGVAELLKDKCTLKKISEGPIISQSKYDPILSGGPFVIEDNGKYRMWYCSATEWKNLHHGLEPIYTVFESESSDGINWKRVSITPSIPYQFDGEVISAPWIVKRSNYYEMYYCYRGSELIDKNYKIGFAISSNGTNWTRVDNNIELKVSDAGWDSEMVCYPAIYISDDSKEYLFYSGNGVGKGGFGVAILM